MPFVVLTGIELKPTPLHTVLVIGLIDGLGFTVTVTVNVVPVQDPVVGITV